MADHASDIGQLTILTCLSLIFLIFFFFFFLPITSSAARPAFTLISINYNFITSTHCSFTCLSYCNTVSVIILLLCVRTFVCKQKKKFTHSPLLFTINHLHYGGRKKKVDISIQCLTHFLNTISLHYAN